MHVSQFLWEAADARYDVFFLDANVAASRQQHIFELVCFDMKHAFDVLAFLYDAGWCREQRRGEAQGHLQANRHFVRDTNLSATQHCLLWRQSDQIKSRSGGGVLVLGAIITMPIATCPRSSCLSRRLPASIWELQWLSLRSTCFHSRAMSPQRWGYPCLEFTLVLDGDH